MVHNQLTINYTVNSNATGSGYVSVTPSGSCGPGKMLTKNLTVGTGAPPTFITIGRDDCWDQRFSTDFAGGASVYTWTIINAANHSSTYYPNHNYQLITGLGGGNYSVVVASACPSATALSQNFTVTCTGGSPSVAVTPNPANSQLIISSTSESAAAPQTQLQVTLIDESGSVVRSAELTEGHKIELNLVGLKKGAYFLHIKRANEIDSRHILIE